MLTSHAFAAVRGRLRASVCRGALGLALLTPFGTSAVAQTFYVDNRSPNCSSSATAGTEAEPYCTINAAMAAHKGPGVTILVKPGVYREQVTINASGAAGSPFVFRATGPGVILEGADDFANSALWVQSAGTSWLAASANLAVKQVFVDGARLALTTELPGSMPVNTFRWVSGEGLYVNLGGGNPGLRSTLVSRRTYGFNMYGKSWVVVEGFEIARSADRGINLQNPSNDIVIANNTVSFTNSYGIQTVNGQRIEIRGNKVSDANFHGIGLTAGASGCVVSGNESFRNAHPTIRQANGIYLSAAPGNLISGNNLHHNQDTGLNFSAASNNCVSVQNRSWANGDHGYDHLGTSGVAHVNDVASGNLIDGFSFEGNSPGGSVFNCIGTNNGIGMNPYTGQPADGNDLWVDAASSVGFTSDHNIWWNSTLQPPVKWISTSYASLAEFRAASGQDLHSRQADPLFANAAAGTFAVGMGSPAIDAAHSGVANWPTTDLLGSSRLDDARIADTGEGPVTYADMGVFEFFPLNEAPVVTSPASVKGLPLIPIVFQVTASDPDGEAIASLRMVQHKMPTNSGATFTPNSSNTGGTFRWTPGVTIGVFQVRFIASNSLADTTSTSIHILKRLWSPYDGELEAGLTGRPLALSNGYPNPSAGDVDFALDLPEAADVEWSVYDMQGRRVQSEARAMPAGQHRLRWDGMTFGRQRAATGIYFVRARVNGTEFVRRVARF